jgi:aryl-alcohol dehydrogenase-like predicted oxidoreductase
MKYRPLGSTGLSVSDIGFGAYPIGGAYDLDGRPHGWSGIDEHSSAAAVTAALETGINFFDTADIYGLGKSEELLGKLLKPVRDRCVLATKVGNVRRADGSWDRVFSGNHIVSSIEGSLRRLKTDRIDLYQLHNPSWDIINRGDVFDCLAQLKREGKIRFYGVSVSQYEEAMFLIKKRCVDAIQIVFNLLHQEPSLGLLKLAETYGIGIVVREPLESGTLTGKYNLHSQFDKQDHRSNFPAAHLSRILRNVEALKPLAQNANLSMATYALRYCLSNAGVSTVIAGARNAEQVRENAAASELRSLTDHELMALKRLWKCDFGFTTPAYRLARTVYRTAKSLVRTCSGAL